MTEFPSFLNAVAECHRDISPLGCSNEEQRSKGREQSMGGCWTHDVYPLPACCDAPALPQSTKSRAPAGLGSARQFANEVSVTLCREMGPAKPGVLGLGRHQRRLPSFLGVCSWELVRLLCVQGAAGPEY